MDRGYDDNKIFPKPDVLCPEYVIRLTAKRKLFYHGKLVLAIELRNPRKPIYLVLVYEITEHPVMLASNKEIHSKEDAIKITRTYFSRLNSKTRSLKFAIIKTADSIKEKFSSAITGWRKVFQAYCRMQKKASGFGFGQNVRHTVSSALFRPLK